MFKLFSSKNKSKIIAKDRLRVLLVSDRVECSPETLQLMKAEIVKVISKYMEIEEAQMDIHIQQQPSQEKKHYIAAICATVPIKNEA